MLNKIALCCSIPLVLASFSSAQAQNIDKVLSPVSAWVEQKNFGEDAIDGCRIGTQFETQVEFSIIGDRAGIRSFEIFDPSASFESQDQADLYLIPNGAQRINAQVITPQSISIHTSGINDLVEQINNAVLAEIRFEDKTYRFSLAGLKSRLGTLTSCRRIKPLKVVNFNKSATNTLKADNIHATSQPLQLYSDVVDEHIELNENMNGRDEIENVAFAPEKLEISAEEKIDDMETVSQSVTDDTSNEIANSITRVHAPKTVIKPAQGHDASTVEKSLNYAGLSEVELKMPPVFHEEIIADSKPLAEQENVPPAEELKFEDDSQPLKRLASINDKTAQIYIEGENYAGIKPVLSQSAEQAETNPVVIPAVDVQSGQQRFDITNPEVTSQGREFTNRDLEESLKRQMPPPVENMPAENNTVQIADESRGNEMSSAPVIREVSAMQDMPLTPVSNEVAPQWVAHAGQNLKEIIARWSLQEGVELIWDAPEQYEILQALTTSKSYEQAIAGLLNQFMVIGMMDRPIGQLYVDPQSGEKMLIVQQNLQ